jgi:hypothetical protein
MDCTALFMNHSRIADEAQDARRELATRQADPNCFHTAIVHTRLSWPVPAQMMKNSLRRCVATLPQERRRVRARL